MQKIAIKKCKAVWFLAHFETIFHSCDRRDRPEFSLNRVSCIVQYT